MTRRSEEGESQECGAEVGREEEAGLRKAPGLLRAPATLESPLRTRCRQGQGRCCSGSSEAQLHRASGEGQRVRCVPQAGPGRARPGLSACSDFLGGKPATFP